MKTSPDSISDVLSLNSTSFYIPPFQRSYAWGESMIERFFSDIIRLIRSEMNPEEHDKQEHFFGTLVLKSEEYNFARRQIIIDGQQRLTTALLFLIALRDCEEDENYKNHINNTFLTNQSSDFSDKIKLKQVTRDWDAYRALVNHTEEIDGTITRAYNHLIKLINEIKGKNPEIKLTHYLTALRRLNVAVIHLDERPHKGEDPQIIFETLNSLGKPLTLSDLIRNYVLLKLNIDLQSNVYETKWYPNIEEKLGDNLSDFFRDYLQYKTTHWHKVVSEGNTKELYQTFKDYVEKTYKDQSEFIDDIIKYVPLYKWILSDNPCPISNSSRNDKEIKELLRNIFSDIKADGFKGLVLGLLEAHQYGLESGRKMTDEVLIESLKSCRTYLIRRRIMKESNGENKNIITLTKYIMDLTNRSKRMFDLLSNMFYRMRLPNDQEIKTTLQNADFYKEYRSYAKFILGKIEEHNTKVAVDFRNPQITIEHIMPQKLDVEWKSALGQKYDQIHNKYLHNIGNLILTEFNSEIGNRSFEYKQEKLKKSSLSYRIGILNETQWNEESILRHRDQMANWFIETFPIPDDMRLTQNWNIKTNDIIVFSPIDEDSGDSAYSQKPSSIELFGETIKVKNWQEVYISFFNRLQKQDKNGWSIVMDNQMELFGRETAVISWKKLRNEIDKEDLPKYKTLQGYTWDKEEQVLSDRTLFLHTNLSTTAMMSRLSKIMTKLYIQREEFLIYLKEHK